jgi:hypothetical protein
MFIEGKQTYHQLSIFFECSIRTIQRRIDRCIVLQNTIFPKFVNLMMDTTYFKRRFGVVCFKDSISKKFLFKKYVLTETNKDYLEGVEHIKLLGITIQAIICDGRRGVINLFPNIPVQMCQFHQSQIVNRYLTKKPKLQASIELQEIVKTITKSTKAEFIKKLEDWKLKWEKFYNERTEKTVAKRGRYIHKKLRSAYKSLCNNLPWLFTYQDYPELNIPNTTNGIDGVFGDLKNKLRNHNGLTDERKKKFIDSYFKI